MASKNQTIGSRGSDIILDVYFYGYDGGNLVNSVPDPTYRILDPTSTEVDSGTGTYVSTGKYTATYSIPIGATLSNQWSIEWTATINGSVFIGAENFIVVEAGDIGFGEDVIIEDKYVNLVKKILGFPRNTNMLLTDLQIKEYCIIPSLREYFKKFPKRSVETVNIAVNQAVEIDFPDEFTFGVLDIKMTHDFVSAGVADGSFWSLVFFDKYGSTAPIGGNYGIDRWNPNGLNQANQLIWQSNNSIRKRYKTEYIDIDTDSRKIYMHTNQQGKLQIDWAKWTYDFSDVKFQQINNVIKLCQAELLYSIADLNDIYTDSNVEVTINASELRAKGDTLREKVLEDWNAMEDIVIIGI